MDMCSRRWVRSCMILTILTFIAFLRTGSSSHMSADVISLSFFSFRTRGERSAVSPHVNASPRLFMLMITDDPFNMLVSTASPFSSVL